MNTKELELRVNRGVISYWKGDVLIGKKCTKCNEDKKIEEFRIKNKKKGNYRAECKECEKRYREANKERTKEYNKQRYEANKECIKEKTKAYKRINKERIKERNKQYREINREHLKEYREINKEHLKEYNKQYREANKKYLKEWHKQWYKVNKNNNIAKNINQITALLHQSNPILKKLDVKAYGYIYKFENVKTGRVYIGQTMRSLEARYRNLNIIQGWVNERKNYDNQKHLGELIEEDFTLEIIDYGVCQYHLDKLEVYYIDKYDSCNNGYNNYAGKYNTTDGLEEFQQILKENNLEFIDNKIIKKRSHK